MKTQSLVTAFAVLIPAAALIALLALTGSVNSNHTASVTVASLADAPSVTQVDPSSAPAADTYNAWVAQLRAEGKFFIKGPRC